ncbi:MAG: UDP-N-acetylglucosamine--N-acetylmuramyl-(pentapeptide) pyrophosphoryl-undecaprenol N-acetylglucosamine transferase, partial [Anaerolineales bacterium]
SAGGTGGGVYPALSVADALRMADGGWRIENQNSEIPNPKSEFLWIGSVGGMEAEIVARAGLPFKAIRGAGVHGVGWRLPLNALNLLWGVFEAVRLVRAFQPNVLLVTGGFVTVPVALAAWLNRTPTLVYLPDVEPGLAIRFISRFARKIAVTVEDSRRYFEGKKVVVTGYPTRPELGTATRAGAIQHFDLDPARRTVLVTGGSRGARSINRATFAALPDWLKDYQVIHLSGQLDWAEAEQAREALPENLRARYHVFPFLHQMGLALAAADLAVSRAGASALGEYPLFGLPAILVPYPHAWRYQKVNADYLAARGAAVRVNDEDLPARLATGVRALLDDPERLAAMRAASAAAAAPDAAAHIARELLALAGARP